MDIVDVNAASDINKNIPAPNIIPPDILAKIEGNTTEISAGPFSGFIHMANKAGNIIKPARMAIIVSKKYIVTADLNRFSRLET